MDEPTRAELVDSPRFDAADQQANQGLKKLDVLRLKVWKLM